VKRYLFELVAWHPGKGVERRSHWISDNWLVTELRSDPDLDRVVEFEPGMFPLDDAPQFHFVAIKAISQKK